MTAATKDFASSVRTVDQDSRPLAAAAKVWKGALAACKAGFYKQASGDPLETVVGIFKSHADNTAGANGDLSATIKFFRPRELRLLVNDTGAPVVVANRETACSFLDDSTATLFSAAKGAGATVYDVTTDGVWVEFFFPSSPLDSGVPPIQMGTTTLVAGTKTVTGVVLTANSIITMSIRDPGAGALTTFIGLDAPVASRAAGQFVINAIDNAKATLATAIPTVDYQIIG